MKNRGFGFSSYQVDSNTLLYTMLSEYCESSLKAAADTLMPSKLLLLENATYRWPWENTGSGRKMPTFSRVCPCALFMVNAYHLGTENWRRFKLNGRSVSVGVKVILGINTFSFFLLPDPISQTNYTKRVPFKRPDFASKFLNSMIGECTCNESLWGGRPDIDKKLRNSVG